MKFFALFSSKTQNFFCDDDDPTSLEAKEISPGKKKKETETEPKSQRPQEKEEKDFRRQTRDAR